jgi:hypothetical protein
MTGNSLLSGKGLLTPLQRSFLSLFSQLADKDQFYLTGGTALAEYYLGRCLSFDLDLFTASTDWCCQSPTRLRRQARRAI